MPNGRALGPAGATVEPLLRSLEALRDEALDRVGRSGDVDGEAVPRARRHALKHEVRRILPAGRTAHPHTDPVEVLRAERFRERADPVVAGAAAAEFTISSSAGISISSWTATTWSASMSCLWATLA